MAIDINQWGFKNKTKWLLIEAAPLTESGLNEILAAAETKAKLKTIAQVLGYINGRNDYGRYQIVKLDDTSKKVTQNG